MTKMRTAILLGALAMLSAIAVPALIAVTADAQGKCWHCYTDAYGKKQCHDDCSCRGTH
jgi:hypothetical protein